MSAWVEYDRATGSEVHHRMVQLITSEEQLLSVTQPVIWKSWLERVTSSGSSICSDFCFGLRYSVSMPPPTLTQPHASTDAVLSQGLLPPGMVDRMIAAVE